MKNLLFLTLLFLLTICCASAQAPPADGPSCMDNCGSFPGDCGACHNQQGPRVWIAEYFYYCADCGGLEALTARPQTPMQPGRVESLWAFVKGITPKADPKYLRLAATNPQRHVALMERAYRLKLDGAALGACSKAFKAGTLGLLPGEIADTRRRLAEYYAVGKLR